MGQKHPVGSQLNHSGLLILLGKEMIQLFPPWHLLLSRCGEENWSSETWIPTEWGKLIHTCFTFFFMSSGKSKDNDFYRLQLGIMIFSNHCCSFWQQKLLTISCNCPRQFSAALWSPCSWPAATPAECRPSTTEMWLPRSGRSPSKILVFSNELFRVS